MSKFKMIIAVVVIVGLFYTYTQSNSNSGRYNKATAEYLAQVMDTKQNGGAGDLKPSETIQAQAQVNEPAKPANYGRIMVTDNNKQDLITKANIYKSKYFPSSPVDMIELVEFVQVENFPLDFILVSGHLESHLCTAGRGKDSNNCHNRNNTDNGDGKPTVCEQYTHCLSDVMVGEKLFVDLIKNCYFKEGEIPSIQGFIDQDFRIQRTVPPHCTAPVGARYMTDGESRNKYIYAVQNFINPIFK